MNGLVDIILGYDCNLACDYCTITPAMRERSLPAARVVAALAQGRSAGYDAVSFTGGEPTIRGDLIPLVRRARELGFDDIKLQSNGLVLATDSNIERLATAGVNRWHVSIHTHQEAAYNELVRRDDSFPLMVAALDNLVKRSVRLTVDVILKSDTYRRLPAAVCWLHGKGIRSVHLWFVSLTDGNENNLHSLPRMVDAVPAMREAFAFARENEMDLRSLHVPRCLLGDDASHAWDPGADRVMVVTPEATFELKDSKLAGRMYVPACDGCEVRDVCPGIRPDYIAHYGDVEIAEARHQAPTVPARRLPVVVSP